MTYLGDQNLVAGGDTHGKALAILVKGTRADSEDLGLVLLLDTALREEDTGGSLSLRLDALDQNAVQEGSEGLDVTEGRLKSRLLVFQMQKDVVARLIGGRGKMRRASRQVNPRGSGAA